jgi:hypothetical protein
MLPTEFCWTKFGVEAGETVESILCRKEAERQRNGGVFLWGIGNSIAPSIPPLLAHQVRPRVVFTPMLSAPAVEDVVPAQVFQWVSATAADGQAYRLPEHTTVTSGQRRGSMPTRHFALVCQSATELRLCGDSDVWIDDALVRNLRSGRQVGGSQVTSVVARVAGPPARARYRVEFMANLIEPYLVRLSGAEAVTGTVSGLARAPR